MKLIITLFLFLLLRQSSCDMLIVTPAATTVGTATRYDFMFLITDSYVFPASSRVIVTFPSQYTSPLTGLSSCTFQTSSGATTPTCSISGLNVTLNGGFPTSYTSSQSQLFTMSFTSITNPGYVITTSQLQLTMTDSSNNAIVTLFTDGMTTTAGTLTCGITASVVTTINSLSTMRFSITPSHSIPSTGKIRITTTQFWPRDPNNVAGSEIFNVTGNTCTNGLNTINTIACQISSILTTPPQFFIFASTLFSTATTSNFVFTLNPFRTPPTTEAQGSFTITSMTASNNIIDQCSNIVVSGMTSASITALDFSMLVRTINVATQATFTFTIVNTLVTTDVINLNFPSDFTLGTGVVRYSGNDLTSTRYANKTITVTGFTSNISPNTQLILTVTAVTNPSSTKQITGFSVGTYRSTYVMDQSTTSPTYQSTAGALVATLSPINPQSSTSTTYSFTVTFGNPITSNSRMFITFPTAFTLATGTFTCTTNQSLTAPTCSYASGTSMMTVTGYVNRTLGANDGVLLTISGITNPVAVGVFSSLSISNTYSTTNDYVDTVISGVSFTVTPRTLSPANINIASSSYTVYSSATLTFTITNFNPVLANSNIFIGFPSELIRVASTCTVNSISKSCDSTTYNSYSGFLIYSAVTTAVATSGLTSYPISITGITMPTSTQPTSSFQIYIINPDNSVSEFLISGLTIAATTPTTYSSLSITSSSSVNYANSNFVFSFLPLFPIWNNSILMITLPSIMTGVSTCVAGTGITSLACSSVTNVINTTLRFTVAQSVATAMSLTVSSMRNYPTLAQYSIQVTLYESSGNYLSTRQSFSLMNTQPNTIGINSGGFSPAIMAQSTTFSLSITPSIAMTTGSTILLTFPSQFTLGTTSCTLPTGLTCSKTGSVITITASSTPSFPITGSITGITAPSSTSSSGVYIQTYGSDGFEMTRDNSIVFAIVCNLYCRTCPGGPSICQTCYTTASLVSGNILKVGDTCSSYCPTGQYQQGTSCITCPVECTACISATQCTYCSSTTYLLNSQCIEPCPNGYFPMNSNRSCVDCSTALHCKTCTNSISCTSCLAPYYNYQSICIVSCPTPITVANTVLYTCDPCPTNCTECSGFSPTVCTKCTPGYLLDQSACAATCVTAGYVPSGLICTGCNSVCLTCSNTPTNCTSCDTAGSNKYLFNHNCLSTCSGRYYNDNNDYTCVLCNSPCETCTSASLSSCLSCVSTFYLYLNTCVQTCPDTYYINGTLCSACLEPCQKCSSASICTSCNSTLFFYNHNCVVSCPAGMIVAPNSNICQNCSENCKSCVGATTQCQTCYETFYLLGGACVTECPSNYYISSTNSCIICTPPCATCTSDTVCVTCVALYNLDGTSCVSTCSGNKIPIDGVCRSCDPACLVCHTTTSNCSSCNAGYLYTDELKRCSSSCPAGYIKFSSNNSCIPVCPSPYYNLSGVCTLCPADCLSCVSSNNCTSCITGLFLYNGLCYSSCPPAFPYYINNQCMSCNIINCQTCSSELCASCKSGYLLIKYTQCITGCPDGQVYNSTALECVIQKNNTDNETQTPALSLTFAPAPIGIAAVASFVLLIITRAQHSEMSIVNAFLPILSTLTLASAVINGIFYYNEKNQIDLIIWLKVAGVGLYLILNFTNSLLECVYLKMDPNFQKTLKNRPSVVAILILSVLLSFKWFVFLSSSFCSIPLLNIKLSKDSYITALRAMFFSSILALGCFIGSSVMYILTLNYYFTFLFFASVELTTLAAIEILLTFMSMSTMDGMVGKIKSKNYEEGSRLEIEPEELFSEQSNTLQKIPLYDERNGGGSREGSRLEIIEQGEEQGKSVRDRKKLKERQKEKEKAREKERQKTLQSQRQKQKTLESQRDKKLKTKQNDDLLIFHDDNYQELISQGQLINQQSIIKQRKLSKQDEESNIFDDQKNKKQSKGKERQNEKLGQKKKIQENVIDDNVRNNKSLLKNSAIQNLVKDKIKENKMESQQREEFLNPFSEAEQEKVGEEDQKNGDRNKVKDQDKNDKNKLNANKSKVENSKKQQQQQTKNKLKQDKPNNSKQYNLLQSPNKQQNSKLQQSKRLQNNKSKLQQINNNQPSNSQQAQPQGDGLRRTDSCQLDKNKPYTPSSGQHESRSAFNHPNDVVKVSNKLIPQAIQEGLFNHDLNSIIENQKKEDEESALEEAPKMNAIMESMKDIGEEQMKKMIEKEQERKLKSKTLEKEKEKQEKQLEQQKQKQKQSQSQKQRQNYNNKPNQNLNNKDQNGNPELQQQDENEFIQNNPRKNSQSNRNQLNKTPIQNKSRLNKNNSNIEGKSPEQNKRNSRNESRIQSSDRSPDPKQRKATQEKQKSKSKDKDRLIENKSKLSRKQSQSLDKDGNKNKSSGKEQDLKKSKLEEEKSPQKANQMRKSSLSNKSKKQQSQKLKTKESTKSKNKSPQKQKFKTQELSEQEGQLEQIQLSKQDPNNDKSNSKSKQKDKSPSPEKKNKIQNRLKSDSSHSNNKRKSNPLDPIDQQQDLGLTMQRKNKQPAPKFPDFKFNNDEQLQQDPESLIAAQMKTLQPKVQKKKRRGSDDDLESIATVEEVDIKLPTISTQQPYRTLQPQQSFSQRSQDNRYLSIEEQDLQRPSQYFRPQKPKIHRPEVISVSSFGSFRSKEISERLNNIGRMSLDNSFEKPPKKPSSKQRR